MCLVVIYYFKICYAYRSTTVDRQLLGDWLYLEMHIFVKTFIL